MIKLSDYVIQFFVDRGVRDAFLVSGGGIMHLLDAVGRNPGLRYYCNYHEQACAIAAEGYARATGRPGLVLGTTGPGAVNALSGMMGGWVDSVPVILLAGQVRTDIIADYDKVRLIGPQEGNAVGMAKPVTKYAVTLKDARRVRWVLEYAWHAATSGRPGPVVIEIPLDLQGATIDETTLEGFTPEPPPADAQRDLERGVARVIEASRAARRPLFVAGNGINASGARELLYRVLEQTGVPIVLPFTAKDLVHETHPLYMGIFGGAGQRRANFTVQNADCLISLATGLNIQKVGFNLAGFAPKARRVMVDIDAGQLACQPVKPDLAVQADIRCFLEEFLRQTKGVDLKPAARWLQACARWKERYPVMTPDYYSDPEHVNTYAIMDVLSEALAPEDQVMTGIGTEIASFYQAYRVKQGQRTYISGWGAMGWCLPLAVGTCIGGGRRTILVTGDGSIQWNVQELMTVAHYRLPVKIFVCNNSGYTCIRATQKNFFQGRFVGSDPGSGVANPDFRHLAAAYGIPYRTIRNNTELAGGVAWALATEGPTMCDLNVAVEQAIYPRVSSVRKEDGTFETRPLEDMAPFLPREEVWENMHLFDADDEAQP
jgi:acetolactate synthase-1/2/3 large subunit